MSTFLFHFHKNFKIIYIMSSLQQNIPSLIHQILKDYNISTHDLNIDHSQFDNISPIHGVFHTYRVLTLVLLISHYRNTPRAGQIGSFCALIHDMARKKDGNCKIHGLASVHTKFYLLKPLCEKFSVSEYEMEIMKSAIAKHSDRTKQTEKNVVDDQLVSLLKDADALDRCRIDDMDEKYLRLKESHNLIGFARDMFNATGNVIANVTYQDFLSLLNDCVMK
ncbi:HD domain-containing protein [Entamoeba marina]